MVRNTAAAVLYETNSDLVVETLNLAAPGPKEVFVQMGAAGVCHSDVHVISGQANQIMPCVLGHEGAGLVTSIGKEVNNVSVGDHVVLSWLPYCGKCYQCVRGKTHLCKAYQTPVGNGTLLDGSCRFSNSEGPVRQLGSLGCWSENVVVPEVCCVPVDKSIPFEIAALLGCAVTTGVGAVLNRAKVQNGETVVVIGAGGVGLSVVMAAKLKGASQVICIDQNISARNLAIELGATDFLVSKQNEDISKKLKKIRSIVCVTSDKCYANNFSTKGFKETDQLGGKDPYSASKACAEIIANSYIRSFFNSKDNIRIATARAGNVIGGGDWSCLLYTSDAADE